MKSKRNIKRRYKSEEQKSALGNIKLLYKSQEAVIKLFNDYYSTLSEAKYKTVHEKEIPSTSARVARSRVVKVKILRPLIIQISKY